jgi:hypothetical protein
VSTDLFGTTIAAILTLMVYSYLLRDNPLYRLAEHLLVATSVAYTFVATVHLVILPRLVQPLVRNPTGRFDLLIPLALGLFLMLKATSGGRRIGTFSLAYIVGVGLALATGGALVGTLFPQTLATMLPLVPIGGQSPLASLGNLVIIVGTIAVLYRFTFVVTSRQPVAEGPQAPASAPAAVWRQVGQWFLMITFGAILGGTTLTYLSLLVARWDFLINTWLRSMLGL